MCMTASTLQEPSHGGRSLALGVETWVCALGDFAQPCSVGETVTAGGWQLGPSDTQRVHGWGTPLWGCHRHPQAKHSRITSRARLRPLCGASPASALSLSRCGGCGGAAPPQRGCPTWRLSQEAATPAEPPFLSIDFSELITSPRLHLGDGCGPAG